MFPVMGGALGDDPEGGRGVSATSGGAQSLPAVDFEFELAVAQCYCRALGGRRGGRDLSNRHRHIAVIVWANSLQSSAPPARDRDSYSYSYSSLHSLAVTAPVVRGRRHGCIHP